MESLVTVTVGLWSMPILTSEPANRQETRGDSHPSPSPDHGRLVGGETSLVRAARVGSAPMVSFLLKKGADPNGFLDDGFKSTALMAGASGNHPQIVAALAAAGADLDQRDALGDPALNWASYMGHIEYARELIERGARRDIRSVHGNSFEIALRQGWDPLIELLGIAARDPSGGPRV